MAKLIRCDGAELTVRDVSEPVYRVRRRDGGPPLLYHGWRITEDAEARAILEELRASDLYITERLP